MENLILTTFTSSDLKNLIKEVLNEENTQKSKAEQNLAADSQTLLSREEAAFYLKVSPPTLNSWTKLGLIASYKISSRRYYKKSELFQALQDLSNQKHKKK